MKIGNTEIKHGVMLAPMAGVTDRSMRALCIEFGAEYTVTEMISAKAMHYKDKKTDILSSVTKEESPIAIQIFGREPDIMAEAAAELERRGGIAAIDINMGCPAHKIISNGEGSALMREPERAGLIIREVASAVKLPVTVKIRSGWDEDSRNAPKVAEIAEKNGAAAVCVHGRTTAQMYRFPVDRDIIKETKNAVSIPVIGNGGILTAGDALVMIEETGCDGIMLAQGACGNPWLFAEINAAIDGAEYISPTKSERLDVAIRHARSLILEKGEYIGVREARKHLAWYTKGMEGSPAFRGRINCAESESELIELINTLR